MTNYVNYNLAKVENLGYKLIMWYCYFENENFECEVMNVVRGDERVE